MTVFGVVDLYQTDRSYWWPGVTVGAHVGFSVIIALRSPLRWRVTSICIALVPVWAAPVTV